MLFRKPVIQAAPGWRYEVAEHVAALAWLLDDGALAIGTAEGGITLWNSRAES